MSLLRSFLLRAIKPILANTVYRPGVVRSILLGPSRGMRYRIYPAFGLAPLYGGCEPELQRVLQIYLKPGNTAYDIGANYGVHTLLMARLVEAEGHVYAFEPVPAVGACLREHISLNHLGNVSMLPYAVADRSASLPFELGHHSGIGHLQAVASSSNPVIRVTTVSVDELVFVQGFRPPNLLKIDVEGAESLVLAGARRTLATYSPMLLVELHTPEQDLAVGSLLAEAGYRAYRLKDGSRVRELRRGWPDPEGLWGQIFALPPRAE